MTMPRLKVASVNGSVPKPNSDGSTRGRAAGHLLDSVRKMVGGVSAPDPGKARRDGELTLGRSATGSVRRSAGQVNDAAARAVTLPAVGAAVKHAGAATGNAAASRAASARMVAEAIERTHTGQAAQAASRSSFLQETAAKVQAAAEKAAREGTRAGGREQLKGHFIERLDVSTYNAKNRLTGKMLVSRANGANPGYDASRYIKGKFAGAIQQKSSAAGTEKAITQIERAKPGSASRATLRVPNDQAARAGARAGGRIRVSEMEFTSRQAGRKLDQGLADLARGGAKATSTVRAVAKGAGIGALVNVALGTAGDARALRRGDIGGRHFAENRTIDAAEGATNAVVRMGAMAAGGMATTAVLGTSTGAAVGASAGAAGTAALGALGGMGTAGAAAAGVLGGVTVASAAPLVVGSAAALGTGVVVSKGFKRVRQRVKAHQHEHGALTSGEPTTALPAAELDDNDAPITDAVVVDAHSIASPSRSVFTAAELDAIPGLIAEPQSADSRAAHGLGQRLRAAGFDPGQWTTPANSFSSDGLHRPIATGTSTAVTS